MLKIKESEDRHAGAITRKLFRRDAIGKEGIDVLIKAGYRPTVGEDTGDIGISKHGDPVPGVPLNKTILLIGEPPIYYGLWNKKLANKEFKNQFLAVMNTCKIDEDDYHFVIPQIFQTWPMFFNIEKNEFLCMILKNKKKNIWYNNMFLSLRKYRKHSLLGLRKEYDSFFCDNAEGYHSYGDGWNHKCFMGQVFNGYETIAKHKFNFCPENSSFEGYITEKPIQAMVCGSIPVYYGPPDVEKYLPKETFIDGREFLYKQDLLGYMKYMDENEYRHYQFYMKKFITTEQSKPFSSVTFAETIVKILEENL